MIQFDDLTGLPDVSASPVNNTAGTYLDVAWQGFTLSEKAKPELPDPVESLKPGLTAQSGPNKITFGFSNPQTLIYGRAVMNTIYAESKVDLIELRKFYFGCLGSTREGLVNVPLSCDFTATCNRGDGTKVGPQVFQFRLETGQLRAGMLPAEPTGFTRCEDVEFAVEGKSPIPGSTDTITGGGIDTVSYAITPKK